MNVKYSCLVSNGGQQAGSRGSDPTESKICIEIYSQPSISVVPHPWIQPISDHTVGPIYRKKMYL